MNFPSKNPKLFKTTVVRCDRCKMWYTRYPNFYGWGGDKGDECEYCGCTSFFEVPGRDIGKKSEKFNDCLEMLKETKNMWDYLSEYEQQNVHDGIVFEDDEVKIDVVINVPINFGENLKEEVQDIVKNALNKR